MMQMEWNIEVEETLCRKVTVEAETLAEALEKVNREYKAERVVLDWSDFICVEIKPAANGSSKISPK
jgi:predicted GTPase